MILDRDRLDGVRLHLSCQQFQPCPTQLQRTAGTRDISGIAALPTDMTWNPVKKNRFSCKAGQPDPHKTTTVVAIPFSLYSQENGREQRIPGSGAQEA